MHNESRLAAPPNDDVALTAVAVLTEPNQASRIYDLGMGEDL
jgi:hypothetical protein